MGLPEFAGNVGLALLFGTLIGAERQWRQHPAGVRTNALVAVGAALFVSLTYLLGETNSPSRIASYIVSGVGFLGGGVILKEGASVRGITTAATLWCSAAVGTLAGAGFGWHAAVGVGVVLFVVTALRPLSKGIDAWQDSRGGAAADYQMRVVCSVEADAVVRRLILGGVHSCTGMRLQMVVTRRKRGRVLLVVEVHARPAQDEFIQGLVSRLLAESGVSSATWQKLPPTAE